MHLANVERTEEGTHKTKSAQIVSCNNKETYWIGAFENAEKNRTTTLVVVVNDFRQILDAYQDVVPLDH